MKKFMKALAVFAAMAMLAGSFVSCSSDDDSSGSKPAATKYTCTNCGTEYSTEAEKNNCAKQAGCPKYVAEATKYKCDGCGTEYDTEAEKENCAKQAGCPKYEAGATKYTCDGCGTEYATEEEKNACDNLKNCAGYVAGTTSLSLDFTSDELANKIKAYSFTTTDADKGATIVETACSIDAEQTMMLGKGTTLTLSKTGTEGLGDKASTSKDPSYKYNKQAECGLVIKLDALKLSGITGNVKVTIKWAINGKKAANDRSICYKIGSSEVKTVGNIDTLKAVDSITAFDDIVETFDFGSEGGDILIGTTNELGIKAVIIEPVADPV